MELTLVEKDVKKLKEALRRCKCALSCLFSSPKGLENKEAARLLEQEIFYLEDQLEQYNSLITFLQEEQGSYDEMLPKV